MARVLNTDPGTVFGTYCETYIGHSTKLPVVRLRYRGPNQNCPLLNKGKCLVHVNKPVVCALYPLGRFLQTKNMDTDRSYLREITYILMPIVCGSQRKKQTVQSWLERFDIPVDDKFFFQWQDLILSLLTKMETINSRNYSDETMNLFYNAVLAGLYLHYEVGKDFLGQFAQNAQQLEALFDRLLICDLQG